MKRVPDQRQQISKQIDNKGTSLGKIYNPNSKYYTFGNQSIVPDNNIGKNFTWRKRLFIYQRTSQYYTPDHYGFANFIKNEKGSGQIYTSYISSNNGFLSDRKLPQYANVVYEIDVYRSTPTTLTIPIKCSKSIRVTVDGPKKAVIDSGDNGPNTKTSVSINIAGQKWTSIKIFFYTSSSNEDENSIDFEIPLLNNVEETRSNFPSVINFINATKGKLSDAVYINWTVDDPLSYQKYQIYYGLTSTGADNLLSTDLPSDVFSYTHAGITGYQHYFYKIRGVSETGQFGEFSSITEGWPTNYSSNSFLNIQLYPNTLINNEETIGYYGPETGNSGYMFLNVNAIRELESGTVPVVTVLDPNGTTIHTGTYISTTSGTSWKFKVLVSGVEFNEGTGTVYATADSYLASSNIYVDKTSPTFYFDVDGDGYFNITNDPYARFSNVFLVPTGNTQDSFTGIYQVRFGNDSAANMSGNNWLNYTNFNTPISWTLSAGTGNKIVYGQARDFAGNISNIASDSIFYATGLIQNITPAAITSGYDKLSISWIKLDRQDLEGYVIYRHVNDSSTPGISEGAYAYIGNATITSFTDPYFGAGGSVFPGSSYHYFIKGYTKYGELSSGFATSPILSGQLRVAPPNSDVAVDTGVIGAQAWVEFRNSSSDDSDSDRRGNWHYIYRKDISQYLAPGNLANAILLTKIFHSGDSSSTFRFTDNPPNPSSFYQYFSNPENKFGYRSNVYTANPAGTGIRINDGPPRKPYISTSLTYANHYNVHLVITGNVNESDMAGYNIYRQEGTVVGNPTSPIYSVIQYNPITNGASGTFDDTRNHIPVPSGNYTYWAQGFDQAGFISDYSDPLTTGLIHTPPPVPIWVSGECYAWFGYNNLVFSGNTDTTQLLAGYRIYRSTGTDSSLATGVGQVLDDRFVGRKNSFQDFDLQYFTQYNYWVTSFNRYGDESNKSAILSGLGVVEPQYGEIFSNYLDNSSFERPFSTDVNWSITNTNAIKTDGGAKGPTYVTVSGLSDGFLNYSGYIFVQPSAQYYFSLYARKHAGVTSNLRTTINFYTLERENSAGSSTLTWSDSTIGTTWTRISGGPFSSPSDATSATLTIKSLSANDQYDVDGIMWEEYSSTKSPRQYVDSRVMSADRMAAHIIVGDMIKARSIDATKIVASSLTALEISGQSITADKLIVPGIGNFISNSNFEQHDENLSDTFTPGSGSYTDHVGQWGAYSSANSETVSFGQAYFGVVDTLFNAGGEVPLFGSYCYRQKITSSAMTWRSAMINVKTNTPYRLSTYYLINNESTASIITGFIGIRAYDANDNLIVGAGNLDSNWTYHSTSKSYYRNGIASSLPRNTWTRTGYDLNITNTNVAKVRVVFGQVSSSTVNDPFYYFDGAMLTNSTEDLEYGGDVYTRLDGWGLTTQSVTADILSANSVTADKIEAEAVIAGKLAADSVTAGTIAAQTIDANKVKIRSSGGELTISGDGMTIGTVSSSSSYTHFTKDRAEYVVSGNVFNFARRVEFLTNLNNDDYISFDPPYRSVPNVMLSCYHMPVFYPAFGTNNQSFRYEPVNISTTGFKIVSYIMSGWNGSNTTNTNSIAISDLDKNIGKMWLGNSGTTPGTNISNFTTQNWISYNNSPQNYQNNTITLTAKMVITGIDYSSFYDTSYYPYQWNLEFIFGRVNGTTLEVSGVVTYSGVLTYADYNQAPFTYKKSATFNVGTPGTQYGFQIRAYQYSTDPDYPDDSVQTIWGSGQFIAALITSGTGNASYRIDATNARFNAVVIE